MSMVTLSARCCPDRFASRLPAVALLHQRLSLGVLSLSLCRDTPMVFRLFLTTFLFLSTMSLTSAADNRDRFEALTFTGASGEKLNYRLLKPKDYDANRKYPLVVF